MQTTGPAKFWHYYQKVWAIISKIHKNSSSWIEKSGKKQNKLLFGRENQEKNTM
jgi:hypothetical protein